MTVVGWLSGSATNGIWLAVLRARADAREVDAGVAELVRDPHVRRPAGEQADAAADLLRALAAQVVVEPDAGRPCDVARHHVGCVAEIGDRQPDWRSACRETSARRSGRRRSASCSSCTRH